MPHRQVLPRLHQQTQQPQLQLILPLHQLQLQSMLLYLSEA
jgi:hypothetical protein